MGALSLLFRIGTFRLKECCPLLGVRIYFGVKPLSKNSTLMLNGDIRSKIDALWNAFWTGGISTPLEVIEQIS